MDTQRHDPVNSLCSKHTPFCPLNLVAAQLLIVIRANYLCNRVTPFFAYWPAGTGSLRLPKRSGMYLQVEILLDTLVKCFPSRIFNPLSLPPSLTASLPSTPKSGRASGQGIEKHKFCKCIIRNYGEQSQSFHLLLHRWMYFCIWERSSYISCWFSTSRKTVSKLTGCCPQLAAGAESFTGPSTVLFCCLLPGDGI